MRTELRQRKLDRAFGHVDVNGEGEIGREDLLGLGARILVGFGESPTSVTGRKLVDSFDAIWSAVTAETGGGRDGRLTREQFHAGMTAAFIDGDRFEPVFRPAAQAVAELCDGDRDGRIGPAEFRTMLSAFGTSYDDIDAAFDRLDLDGEGTLAVGDLVAASRQFYADDDPNAPGNWLYGPL